MSDDAPWFYSIFVGQTREACIETLGPDAFELTAREIVELLDAAGYSPDVLDPSREPLNSPGVTTTIRDDDRTFLVSIDELAGVIAVQERTDEAFPDE